MPKKTAASNIQLRVLLATCILNLIMAGLILNTIGMYYRPFEQEFHVTRGIVALVSTLTGIGSAIGLLVADYLIRWLGPKRILTAALLISAVSAFAISSSHSMTMLFIGFLILGVCQPLSYALITPVLLARWFHLQMVKVLGIATALTALGGMLFSPLVNWMISSFSWRISWVAEGTIILVLVLPCVRLLIPTDSDQKTVQESESSHGIDSKRSVYRSLISIFIVAGALYFISGIAVHINAFGLSKALSGTQSAFLNSAFMIGAFLGKLTIGWFLSKLPNRMVTTVYVLLATLGMLGMILSQNFYLLVVFVLMIGLGQAIVLVQVPLILQEHLAPYQYTRVLSRLILVGTIATAFANAANGFIFDYFQNYQYQLLLNVLLYVFAGLILQKSLRTEEKRFRNHVAQPRI